MFELKPLSNQAIPGALEKARHYRLLNDPQQAESICRDILATDSENQSAIHTMILAITDQFGYKYKTTLSQAKKWIAKIDDSYLRQYLNGLAHERQAVAALSRQSPRAGYIAYEYFRQAMHWYEHAEMERPADNDESILRWNACARMIEKYKLQPAPEEQGMQPFLDV